MGCAVPGFLEPSVPLGVCTQANTGGVGLVGLGSPHALGPVEPSAFHVLIVVPTSPKLFVVWLLECLGILHGSWQPQTKAHVFICSNPNHISFWTQLQQRQVGRPLRPSWFCPDLSSALLSSTGTTPKNPRNCHCLSLWLVTHFSKCPETVHSGGWRYCFSPFPCKSPVSPMWPWQLPSNSLDVSIFSYSSHFTWIVFIHIRSSVTHLNQVFLEAKPTQSACKWSLGIWSGFKYAKTLIEEPSSGKEDIHQEFLTVERSWVPDKSGIVIQIWEHNGSLSKWALLQKIKIKKGCQGQF